MSTERKLVELHDVTNHPIVQKRLREANEMLKNTDLSPIYEARRQRADAKKD